MRRTTPVVRAIGVNRRWLRNIRLWLVVGAIIVGLVAFWAFRAFQVGPLLFPPPEATTGQGMAVSEAAWPSIRRDIGGTGWASAAAPAPPFAVLWERDTPGVMLAPPSVVDGRAYITTEDGVVAALDAGAGETVWSYEIGSPSDSAPAVSDSAIYVGARNHRLLAVDRESGQLRWERNLGNIVLGSAIVVDGTVYIGSTNSRLEALDAATGEPRWSARIKGWVVGHPASDGSVVAAASLGERFITVDPDTGRRRLVFYSGTPVVGGPVIADGRAYFVTNRGGVWAVDPSAVSRPFSRFAYVAKFNFFYWRLLQDAPQQTGSLWVGSARGRVKYSPVYADGILMVVNEKGVVRALDGATGAELWERALEAEISAEPVAAGDVLLIATATRRLVALDVASGAVAWEYALDGGGLSAAPVASEGTLYLPMADGRLVALRGE